VVRQPYLNYVECFAFSSFGLALTYQAQGQAAKAREVAEAATKFLLEAGNSYLLPIAQAFEAELALMRPLMRGQLVTANRWAARLDPIPPLTPIFGIFSPHLTLVKVWLAQDTPASRGQAADLLEKVKEFVETTHNTRFLIETLALQALLYDVEGDEPAALDALEHPITLAEAGGFIRLFVDLGPSMARLLDQLHRQGVAPNYITQILAAFGTKDDADADIRRRTDAGPSSLVPPALRAGASVGPSSPLIEPLTHREQDVLELLAQRLSNKEIAEHLVISHHTVKGYTKSIFAKLNVNNRRQAAIRARELGLFPLNNPPD
jgi:LuxR family maltose regulon positive regulatory protein